MYIYNIYNIYNIYIYIIHIYYIHIYDISNWLVLRAKIGNNFGGTGIPHFQTTIHEIH